MPSADFCSAVRWPLDPLSRRSDDTGQISRGKLNRLQCTTAGSTLRALDGCGLRDTLPARPALAPPIRFLFIGSHLCSTLPLDPASRRQPLRLSGRGAGYPTPPPQIPACGFPAPGSRQRSNAMVGLDATDPQARGFCDMLNPALSPEHALLLTFPSTGRLPSAISAADFSQLCSMLQRYYAAVRLLVCSSTASSPRLPVAARDRSSDCGPDEVSQVPTRSFRT